MASIDGLNQTKRPEIIPFHRSELQMSAYERVASWLLAMLISVTAVTGTLFLMWLGQTWRYRPPMYTLSIQEEGYGRGDNPAGFARDSRAPGDPDLEQLDEPAGTELSEVMEDQSEIPTAFIEDAANATIAEIGDVVADSSNAGRAAGFGGTGGGEGGLGDSRPPGPMGDGLSVISRWERWELRLTSSSLNGYAQQLDRFKFELAAIGGSREIEYVSNVSSSTPTKRTGSPKDEKRIYLTWRSGTLKNFDRQLLARANVSTAGRLIVQFLSPDSEKMLATLEAENAKGRSPREFFKTIFSVRNDGGNMEFYVVDQQFRTVVGNR